MNDTLLLTQVESLDTNHWNQGTVANPKASSRTFQAKGLNQRYNVSNDEAYDLLKANHQSKVRSTLGTLSVEHSLPAVRLQWPYVCYASFNSGCFNLVKLLILSSIKPDLKNRKLDPFIGLQ